MLDIFDWQDLNETWWVSHVKWWGMDIDEMLTYYTITNWIN